MLKGIDQFVLYEGLGPKGKSFLELLKAILSKNVSELYTLARQSNEGIFVMSAITESANAPKGELATIGSGRDHRAVAVRFIAADGAEKLMYFVVPLTDFSGEELTDSNVLSGIQNRIKDIHSEMGDGLDASETLGTIFMTPEAAMTQLKQIDGSAMHGSQAERDAFTQQAPDQLRDAIATYANTYFQDPKLTQTIMGLGPNILGNALSQFSWDPESTEDFSHHAAAIIGDGTLENPVTIKRMAELALAHMGKNILDRIEK